MCKDYKGSGDVTDGKRSPNKLRYNKRILCQDFQFVSAKTQLEKIESINQSKIKNHWYISNISSF